MTAQVRIVMQFIDSTIAVQHKCPFCDLSATFPTARMAMWCNGLHDMLHITATGSLDLSTIMDAANEYLGARDFVHEQRSALTIIQACRCSDYDSVTTIADKCGSWLVPPSTYYGGWETHRVITDSSGSLGQLVSEIRKIGTVKVLSKHTRKELDIVRDLGVVPVHFFNGLTDKQIHIMVTAFEHGLFDIPTREKMDDVAKKIGLSRSTFGEHLRKAQLQIMRNSYPFLKLMDMGKRQ